MPALITNKPSDPTEGEINVHDLRRITEDFENFAELKSTIQRQFLKISSISIPRAILLALLEGHDKYDYVNIRFGITLPDQKSCEDFETDISNQLTIAILRAKRSGKVIIEKNSVGDFVVLAGFKTSIKEIETWCCGNPSSGRPGSTI